MFYVDHKLFRFSPFPNRAKGFMLIINNSNAPPRPTGPSCCMLIINNSSAPPHPTGPSCFMLIINNSNAPPPPNRAKVYNSLTGEEELGSHDDSSLRLSYHRVDVGLMSDADIQNIMRSASAETLPQQQLLDSQVSVCVCVCSVCCVREREGGCGVC